MGRSVNDVIARTVAELPPPLCELVQTSIKFVVRKKPNAADLAHGAQPDDRGIFVGYPVLSEEDEDAGELYAEPGDDLAVHESAAVLRADDRSRRETFDGLVRDLRQVVAAM